MLKILWNCFFTGFVMLNFREFIRAYRPGALHRRAGSRNEGLLFVAPRGVFGTCLASRTWNSAAQAKKPLPEGKGFAFCSSNRTRTCIYGLGNRYSIP